MRYYQRLPENSPIATDIWILEADVDMWYSYVSQGLLNTIQNHCRKDQRTYQRRFCAALSKLHRFVDNHPEEFI